VVVAYLSQFSYSLTAAAVGGVIIISSSLLRRCNNNRFWRAQLYPHILHNNTRAAVFSPRHKDHQTDRFVPLYILVQLYNMYINIKMSCTSRTIIKMWVPKIAFLFFILSSYTTGYNPNTP